MPTDGNFQIKQKQFCYRCNLYKAHSYSKGLCVRRNKYVKKYKECCNLV